MPDGRAPRICIFARKDLTHNTRVARQAKVLEEAGFEVVVVSIRPPHADLIARTSTVRYIVVETAPPLLKFVRSNKVKGLLGGMDRQKERFRRNAWEKKVEAARAAGKEPPAFEPALAPTGARALKRTVAHRAMLFAMRLTGLRPEQGQPDMAWMQRHGSHEAVLQMVSAAMPVLVTREFCRRAAEAVEAEHFDIVQPHDSMALGAAKLAADRLKCPILYDAVEIPDDRSGWSLQRTPAWLLRLEAFMDARVIRRSAGVITVSNGLADWMVKRYAIARPDLVRNCRLYEEIEPNDEIRRDLGVGDGQQLALYLNSLYPGQGLEQLVDSIAHMPEHIHVATLGPITKQGYAEGLFERAEGLGVRGRFHVLPSKPPEQMLRYAAGADIGVVPRQNTSFNNYISLPNRIFELTMSRLPIAAPSLPDMKLFVEQYGIGIAFDETDPKDIARVVTEMLEPARLAAFQAAVRDVAVELSWEREGARYVGYVAKALGLALNHSHHGRKQ